MFQIRVLMTLARVKSGVIVELPEATGEKVQWNPTSLNRCLISTTNKLKFDDLLKTLPSDLIDGEADSVKEPGEIVIEQTDHQEEYEEQKSKIEETLDLLAKNKKMKYKKTQKNRFY